jgi:hypothetical protein
MAVAPDAIAVGACILWFQRETHTGAPSGSPADAGLTVVMDFA